MSLHLAGGERIVRTHAVSDPTSAQSPGALPRVCAALVLRSAFLRRALVRKPVFGSISNARYRTRLARHADRVPTLTPLDDGVLADLRATGVAVRNLEFPADVQASLDDVVNQLRAEESDRSCISIAGQELGDQPELVTWGLNPRLLDLAEAYIGLPVRYHGLEVKREMVSADVTRPRRWHLDDEDRCMLKVIVYLSDVDSRSAPFGYVDVSNTEKVRQMVRRDEDPVPDAVMQNVVPREDWNHVTGPRLTTVYADTAQVFHRVFPATTTERYSVTFAYSSRKPFYTYSRLMLPPRSVLRRLRSQLTSRQWDALCVPGPNDLPEEQFRAFTALV